MTRQEKTSLISAERINPATGDLTSINYSDATPDVAFTYDRVGRQKMVTDTVGTREFVYNEDDLQLTAKYFPENGPSPDFWIRELLSQMVRSNCDRFRGAICLDDCSFKGRTVGLPLIMVSSCSMEDEYDFLLTVRHELYHVLQSCWGQANTDCSACLKREVVANEISSPCDHFWDPELQCQCIAAAASVSCVRTGACIGLPFSHVRKAKEFCPYQRE